MQAFFTHKLLFWRVLTNKCKGYLGGGIFQKFIEKPLFLSKKEALDGDLGPQKGFQGLFISFIPASLEEIFLR